MAASRVVIADDDEDIRVLLRLWVPKRTSANVVGEAADGNEALELWTALRPDVIVLDQEMPGVTGAEAARRIKDEDPTMRVIIFTGKKRHGLRDLERDHPDVEVLSKPDLEALAALVEAPSD